MSFNKNSIAINASETLMFNEAQSAPAIVEAQLARNQARIRHIVQQIRDFAPSTIVTMARGSSDHAATYFKYLAESQLGLVTSSASPSISSVYGANQQLNKTLYLAISQSGASPDLLAGVQRAKNTGALVLAIVNVENSPLAKLADLVLPTHAGEERSVAATKSYITTLSAMLHLICEWHNSDELSSALTRLPMQLANAWEQDWSTLCIPALENTHNMFVIGRGYGFGVAQEAALKFKETCGLHAEAFSSAEVKHGPMAIVNADFPVLIMAQQDATSEGTEALVTSFKARGAKVLYASSTASANLAVISEAHPVSAPILAIQSFYRMVNGLAVVRGYNPDIPPHLNKVTETL